MRIPLELLRIVLLYAEPELTRAELMQLRLVNSLFDEEILFLLLSDHKDDHEHRLINGNSWISASTNLRMRYMRFRLRMRGREPSLFSHLFLPIYERRLAELGITEEDGERREATLDELLRIPTYDRRTSWVVAHKRTKFFNAVFRALFEEFGLGDPESENFETDPAFLWKRQFDNDYQLALISTAILRGDEEAVMSIIREDELNVSRLSHCFGTSILKFALSHATIPVVRRILEKRWQFERDNYTNYNLFVLASERATSSDEVVTVVLEHTMALKNTIGFHYKCKNLLVYVLQKACREGRLIIVDSIVRWLRNDCDWKPELKQWFLDGAFPVAIRSGHIAIIEQLCREVDVERSFGGLQAIKLVAFGNKPDVALLHLLLQNGANVDRGTYEYWYDAPIFLVASRGWIDWVEVLLQAGAKPRSKNGEQSLLDVAESDGKYAELTFLMEKFGWSVQQDEKADGKSKIKETYKKPSSGCKCEPQDYLRISRLESMQAAGFTDTPASRNLEVQEHQKAKADSPMEVRAWVRGLWRMISRA